MYNLPDIKTTRTTSLGYGKKVDFSKMGPSSPAPNTYNRGSTFDSKQGFSFRLNREVTIRERQTTTKFSKLHTIPSQHQHLENINNFIVITNKQVKCGQMFVENRNPSPTEYKIGSYLSKVSYTMRNLTKNPENKFTNKQTPGPGTYSDSMRMSSSGHYFFSNYKDTKEGALINPEQHPKKRKLSPGPGEYQDKDQLNSLGLYTNSKYSNTLRTMFPKSNRYKMQNVSYGPGPGGYKQPSDFGQYGSSRALLNKLNETTVRSSSDKLSSSFLGSDYMKRNTHKNLHRDRALNLSLNSSFYATKQEHSPRGSPRRRI